MECLYFLKIKLCDQFHDPLIWNFSQLLIPHQNMSQPVWKKHEHYILFENLIDWLFAYRDACTVLGNRSRKITSIAAIIPKWLFTFQENRGAKGKYFFDSSLQNDKKSIGLIIASEDSTIGIEAYFESFFGKLFFLMIRQIFEGKYFIKNYFDLFIDSFAC